MFRRVVAVACVLTAGCSYPFLKRDPTMPDPKPSPALMVGFVAQFDGAVVSATGEYILDTAVHVALNSRLAPFGAEATARIAEALGEHGYAVTYDASRVQRLNHLKIGRRPLTAELTGIWRHPESSAHSLDTLEDVRVPLDFILRQLAVEGRHEYFAFTQINP